MHTKSTLAASLSLCAALIAISGPSTAGSSARTVAASGAPGSLDLSFGNRGKVTTQVNPQGNEAAFVQPDGKIVVIATLNDFKIASAVFGVLRYLSNGQLDLGFGTGGIVRTAFTNGFNISNHGVRQADGKIVVVGSASSQNKLFQSIDEIALARYNFNGSLDGAFGDGGKVTTTLLGNSDVANVTLVQPDGKILVGGSALTCFGRRCGQETALLRYDANGALDSTFGSGGKVVVSGQGNIGAINALALERDGSILALAARSLLSSTIPVVRFSANGTQEPVAAPGFIIATAAEGNAIFLPDGRVLLGGSIRGITKRDSDVHVQRFTAQGFADPSFLSAPFDFAFETTPNMQDFVQALAVTASGKIVAGGAAQTPNFQDVFGLARLNANGALDASFGNGGLVTTTFANRDSIGALALQPDGKIVAVGFSGSGNTAIPNSLAVARYLNQL